MDEVPVESSLSGLVSRCQAHRRALVQVATATWSWPVLHPTSSPHWQPLVSAGDWHSEIQIRSNQGIGRVGGTAWREEWKGVEGEWITYQTPAVTLLCLASSPA